MHAPFMLTVVPTGIENEVIFGEMPSLFVHKFMVSGMETPLLLVAKGIDQNAGIFFKKDAGEIFPKNLIINI